MRKGAVEEEIGDDKTTRRTRNERRKN